MFIYKELMLVSASVILLLGILLGGLHIPTERGLEQLRKARGILVPSYFVVALLSLLCFFTGYDPDIDPGTTIIVASFQALLFTMAMLVFIRPGEVRWRTILLHAGYITTGSAILLLALFFAPALYPWVFLAAIFAYIVQLAAYTRIFLKAYRKTVQEVENYYDDDEEISLRWVATGFYSALTIGTMALFSLVFHRWFYLIFVPVYTAYYAFVVSRFENYWGRMNFIIPVVAIPKTDTATTEKQKKTVRAALSSKESPLKEKLQKYMDEKEYCQKDVPAEELLRYLDTDAASLRHYMKEQYGMDFRPWRNKLRMEEAYQILLEHPEYTVKQVCDLVGFKDGSNFSRYFKKMTGQGPKEYCQALLDKQVQK